MNLVVPVTSYGYTHGTLITTQHLTKKKFRLVKKKKSHLSSLFRIPVKVTILNMSVNFENNYKNGHFDLSAGSGLLLSYKET